MLAWRYCTLIDMHLHLDLSEADRDLCWPVVVMGKDNDAYPAAGHLHHHQQLLIIIDLASICVE
jgi:hypothetical protein